MLLAPLAVGPGERAADVLPLLAQVMAGAGPLLVPHSAGSAPPSLGLAGPEDSRAHGVPEDAAIAIATSGSSRSARLAVLSASALAASAAATHARLGGPGVWVAALPAHHIAGLQVLLRSLAAGHEPVFVERDGPFGAAAFAQAAGRAAQEHPRARRYTALVPTQLIRLLDDPVGVEALAGFDAVLVGGAATSPVTAQRALRWGIPVVRTYGMSETAGGCVYDGLPLDGARAWLRGNQIHLAGPMLAHGYLVDGRLSDGGVFGVDGDGQRYLRTDDYGHLVHAELVDDVDDVDDGYAAPPADPGLSESPLGEHVIDSRAELRLVVDGRLDDLIITGGLKVAPREVEHALEAVLPPGTQVLVVGVPDPDWGARIGALVAPRRAPGVSGSAAVQELAAALPGALRQLAARTPAHAQPRQVRVVADLPVRGPGKPDRAAAQALLRA